MEQQQTKRWYKKWYLWVIMYITCTWWLGLVFLIIDLKKDHEALKKKLEDTYKNTPEYAKERLKEIDDEMNRLTLEAERLEKKGGEKT